MQNIPWQRWAITFLVLILLGLAADYYFMHILFHQKQLAATEMKNSAAAEGTTPVSSGLSAHSADSDAPAPVVAQDKGSASQAENNFLKSLQSCRPDLTAQGVTTPEALLTYLNKSVGIQSEIKEVENYNIKLPDGSERRIHIIPADNENSKNRIEMRYFKLDAEGYPERIPLKPEQTFDPQPEFLNSLISQGSIKLHQIRSIAKLKDNSTLSLDMRNDRVFEFQLRGDNKTLSCRELNCLCQ